MAFSSRNLVVENTKQPVEQAPEQPQQAVPSSELNLEELEFLLKVLGNADLKGHQVEMFYNMVVKLQNTYLQKSKK